MVEQETEQQCPVDNLYLSGGGFRAALGGAGAVAYLASRGWWDHDPSDDKRRQVNQVVSVSGGSLVNGALLAGGHHQAMNVIEDFLERIDGDRARPWATRQRLALTIGALLAVAGLVAVVAVAARIHVVLAVFGGVAFVPFVLFVFRWYFSGYTRDLARVATRSRPVADPVSLERAKRMHVVCATGLASGLPHFVRWGSNDHVHAGWGVVHEGHMMGSDVDGIRLDDAVFASTSLPGAGRFRAPEHASRSGTHEMLIDGGSSGIFGDAFTTEFDQGADNTGKRRPMKSSYYLAIDGGRHQPSVGGPLRMLFRTSFLIRLFRWLQVNAETAYINDLLDLEQTKVVRLCHDRYLARNAEQPSLSGYYQSNVVPTALDDRLDMLRESMSQLGLLSLNRQTIASAVLTGIVGTAQVVNRLDDQRPELTPTEIDRLIAEIGDQLGWRPELEAAWRATEPGAAKTYYSQPTQGQAMSHKGVTAGPCTASPYTASAYCAAIDAGFTSIQIDLVERDWELHAEHAIFGRPISLPFKRSEPGETLGSIVEKVVEHAKASNVEVADLRFNLEFKSVRLVDPLAEYLELVQDDRYEVGPSQFLLSAPFHTRSLRALRRLHPNVATSESLIEGGLIGRPLSVRKRVRETSAAGCQLWALKPFFARTIPIVPWTIRSARKRGKSVHVWTVNDAEHALLMLDAGALVLISDQSSMASTVNSLVANSGPYPVVDSTTVSTPTCQPAQ